MPTAPRVLTIDELRAPTELARPAGSWLTGACALASDRFEAFVRERLAIPRVASLEDVPADARALVVVGGGTRIDEAKAWRHHARPGLALIAIPSVWGSGAEASPIVVLNRDGAKEIEIDDALLPDVRVVAPELVETLPLPRALDATGDALAHALEGFASPIASDELRAEGARLLTEMVELPLAVDARWLELSARACALQSRSSVGLVHGIAHVLEGPAQAIWSELPSERTLGHARLCRAYLAPVLAFDRATSSSLADKASAHGLDLERVAQVAGALFEPDVYRRLLPLLAERWRDVLRDPCTRTNVALVRPAHLADLEAFGSTDATDSTNSRRGAPEEGDARAEGATP